jgi:hypothetical protein
MKITPDIKETRSDGTPYRVGKVTIEANHIRDERVLAAIAHVLSRLDEVHFTTNTVRLKGKPKKRTRR